MMPTRSVSLDIDGKTVHRNFKTTIRDAIHGTALLEEMQVRYNWPDGTLEFIDWEAHRQATQAQRNRRTHFAKLCHELLPAGHLVCTYGTGLPDYCPLCKTPKEDFHHVLKCYHPSRVQWRDTLFSSLKDQCYKLKTAPPLVEILITGITSFFEDRQFPIEDFEPAYRQLIREQDQIGWSQIFRGRLTMQWSLLQQDHYSGLKPVKGQDGTSWSRLILSHIFTQWLSLWDERNKARHGQDSTTRHVAQREQVCRELDILYTYKPSVLHRDRDIFFNDINEHKTKPTHAIRQWINTYQPLILKSIKDAKKHSLLHVSTVSVVNVITRNYTRYKRARAIASFRGRLLL
jgi:hypothetical protein